MSDQDLRDELITLLVAGHETDRQRAGLGGRAARPPPGQARPPRRGGARRWRGLHAGRRAGDAAAATGDLDRPARGQGADDPCGLRAAAGPPGRAGDLSRQPPARALPRTRDVPARAVSRRGGVAGRREPTPGSRSAAACAAAWARRSRSSRWRRCCASSPAQDDPARPDAVRVRTGAARSPRPRRVMPRCWSADRLDGCERWTAPDARSRSMSEEQRPRVRSRSGPAGGGRPGVAGRVGHPDDGKASSSEHSRPVLRTDVQLCPIAAQKSAHAFRKRPPASSSARPGVHGRPQRSHRPPPPGPQPAFPDAELYRPQPRRGYPVTGGGTAGRWAS